MTSMEEADMGAVRNPEPDVMAQLSAQHLRTSTEERDGGIKVLYLQDGVSAIEVTAEMGSLLAAADGLQRLADHAGELADELRAQHRARQEKIANDRAVNDYKAWWNE
jgi:hypothetical protein